MSKKVLIIVGLAAVLAVSAGAVSIAGSNAKPRGADGDPLNTDAPSYTEYAEDIADPDTGESPEDDDADSSDSAGDETVAEQGGDEYGYADDIVNVSSYNVVRVVDHTTDEDCSLQEVFGRQYGSCYLSFKSDNTLEICLNPVADEIRRGKYSIYGDVIYVEYDDGVGTEYGVISDGAGSIDYIIVNYGDYDVYFG